MDEKIAKRLRLCLEAGHLELFTLILADLSSAHPYLEIVDPATGDTPLEYLARLSLFYQPLSELVPPARRREPSGELGCVSYTVRSGRLDIVKWLLAQPNIASDRALLIASTNWDNAPITRLLIRASTTNLRATDEIGRTALWNLCSSRRSPFAEDAEAIWRDLLAAARNQRVDLREAIEDRSALSEAEATTMYIHRGVTETAVAEWWEPGRRYSCLEIAKARSSPLLRLFKRYI